LVFDNIEFERSHMALLAGFGFIAMIGVFYFFLRDKESIVYVLAIAAISLASLMIFFYLFDKTKFAPEFITETNSNLVAGMFLSGIIFLNIISFTQIDTDPLDDAVILLLSLLTTSTIFLFMTSLLLDE